MSDSLSLCVGPSSGAREGLSSTGNPLAVSTEVWWWLLEVREFRIIHLFRTAFRSLVAKPDCSCSALRLSKIALQTLAPDTSPNDNHLEQDLREFCVLCGM